MEINYEDIINCKIHKARKREFYVKITHKNILLANPIEIIIYSINIDTRLNILSKGRFAIINTK
jgi:hypothetical protein